MNCIFLDSVRTERNFSPARKVRSITFPSLLLRSFVRTNAPPLPGLTCWKSSTLKTVPSTSMWLPLLSWLVVMVLIRVLAAPSIRAPTPRSRHKTSRRGVGSGDDRQLLGQPRQDVGLGVGDRDEVLDAHAETPRQVDARLDRHDASGLQRLVAGGARQTGCLVDLHPDPVAETMPEVLAVAALLDDRARHTVELAAAAPGARGRERLLLGREHQRI